MNGRMKGRKGSESPFLYKSTIILVHVVSPAASRTTPSASATASTSPVTTSVASSSTLFVLEVLQFLNGDSLSLGYLLCKHHDLFSGSIVLFQRFTKSFLNALVNLHIVLGDKADGNTTLSGTGCTTNSVNIGFWKTVSVFCLILGGGERTAVCGKVQIQHHVDTGNIKTTSSNVGSNKDLATSRAEL